MAMDLLRPASTEAILRVGEGPAVEFEMQDEVKSTQYPFAYRLLRSLEKNAAVIGFQAGEYKHGEYGFSGPIGSDRIVHMWNQCYACRDDQADELANLLLHRFGKLITFGEMIMPPARAMQWVGFQKAGPVWVRNVGIYDPSTDSVVQRFDVLARETYEAKTGA